MARPLYASPFGCGPRIGNYRGTTYPGHSAWSVDFNGIDGSDIGDPVHAMTAGRVIFILPSNGQVHVMGDDGWGWIVAHCRRITVKVGDRVTRRQQIAELGNEGIGSTGPHLHVNHLRRKLIDGESRIVTVKVVIEGVAYAASVAVNDAYRHGALIDGCTAVVPPAPGPEDERMLTQTVTVLRPPRGLAYGPGSLTAWRPQSGHLVSAKTVTFDAESRATAEAQVDVVSSAPTETATYYRLADGPFKGLLLRDLRVRLDPAPPVVDPAVGLARAYDDGLGAAEAAVAALPRRSA